MEINDQNRHRTASKIDKPQLGLVLPMGRTKRLANPERKCGKTPPKEGAH